VKFQPNPDNFRVKASLICKIWQMKKPSFLASFVLCFFALALVRRFFPSTLLYEQINFIALCSVICSYFVRNPHWKVKKFEKITQILLISISVSFVLNTVLLNIDRSRSFYVLSWVSNNQIKNTSGELVISVRSKEALNQEGVNLRLNENIARGLIKKSDDIFILTSRGKILLEVSEKFANLFNLKNWKANAT
jgi:hypothetical protein